MRTLSLQEKEQLRTRPMKRQGLVRTYLMNMKPGDIIFIENHEWTMRSKAPSYLCQRVARDTGWKFECEAVVGATGGWVITRLS